MNNKILIIGGLAAMGLLIYYLKKQSTAPPPEEPPPEEPPPEEPPPPEMASVTGYVAQGDYHLAVENAQVTIAGRTVFTNNNGRFNLDNLAPGPVTIQVIAGGFDPYETEIILLPGENVIEIYLSQVAPYTASVSGFITDINNQPVAGAMVTVAGYDRYTDANGFFQFTSMPVASVSWRISKDGYETRTGTIVLQPGINTLSITLVQISPETYGSPFTFGTPYNYGTRPNPAGSGDLIPYFSVPITNNSTAPARHLISVYCDYFNKQTETIIYDNLFITQEYIELAPGQSMMFTFDSYNEWLVNPGGVMVTLGSWTYAHFWIQDEMGNKSAEVSL